MSTRLTRSRFLRGALGTAGALALAPSRGWAAALTAPRLIGISVRNTGGRYEGDRPLFATVSPGVFGRDTAAVSFELKRAATVQVDVVRTALRQRKVVWTTRTTLPVGRQSLTWTPAADIPVGTYVVRLTVESDTGARRVYGGQRPAVPGQSRAPVVRVLGIEAAFDRRSYVPGEPMKLTVFADAPTLTLQFLRSGAEKDSTDRIDEIKGVPLGDPVPLDWTGKRSAPATIAIQAGEWPTGFYAVRLDAGDGRVGFAPFVLRPKVLGTTRQALILPTNTWQAYNFYDADGDGWGDTWYAGPPHQKVALERPFLHRGVPPFFYRYDQGFLHWLYWTGKKVDFLAESDLESLSADQLAAAYDLIIFPGHTEYVTDHEFDAVQGYRDLGGNLAFLSANNFFWRVLRDGDVLTRTTQWRDLRRPEASLIGVQYLANDRGERQGVFTVGDTTLAPWLWAGTGLDTGSTFGEAVGGYGIEIDHISPDSPPGTRVLAEIPDLFGAGVTAQMSYYETAAGAKVFAAGALDFGGSAITSPVDTMLENLWARLTRP